MGKLSGLETHAYGEVNFVFNVWATCSPHVSYYGTNQSHRTVSLSHYCSTANTHLSNLGFILGDQRGKWAARTIRFESSGLENLPDGTPLGGAIVWNSKRLFPREQRGVSIADIARVEHSGAVS